MLVGFVILITITVVSLSVPVYMNYIGYTMPSWIWDMLGSFIGAVVAIAGSVSFQLLTEKRKAELMYEKNLQLLKEELYSNFIVCLHRIVNSSTEIEFFNDAHKNFITMSDGLRDKEKLNTYSELSKLYFIICRGHQTLKTANAFFHEVFNIQKKHPRNFLEVKEIIQSAGIDYIYEFAVIRYIILLNKNHKLNLILPFHDFERVVQYEQKLDYDMEDCIVNYISEQVCKKIFSNDRILYYHKLLHEKEY